MSILKNNPVKRQAIIVNLDLFQLSTSMYGHRSRLNYINSNLLPPYLLINTGTTTVNKELL